MRTDLFQDWRRRHLYLLGILIILPFIGFGCKTKSMLGTWAGEKHMIDGLNQEWHNGLTFIEKEKLSVGIRNDADYVYLAIVTGDRQTQRLAIMRGFTVWLDSTGGKRKHFGIKYPYGLADSGFPMPGRERGGMGQGQREQTSESDRDTFARLAEISLKKLEILGRQEEDAITIVRGESHGIEVEVGNNNGTFIYELKIPLQRDDDHPFAIGQLKDGKLGVGFEIAEIDREEMREQMGDRGSKSGGRGGGRGGTGGGRGGGGRGGNRGGGMGGTRPEMSSPLKTWMKVQLSDPPSRE